MATRSRCGRTGTRCERGSSLRERMRPGAAFLIEGTAHRQRERAQRRRAGRDREADPADASGRRVIPLADVNFAEATWIMIVKSILIFLGGVHDRPGADRGRAQADRPLPAPLRAQPGRPGRADAAARRHPQAARQAAVPPGRRGPVPVCARAGARDHLRDHDDRDPALRQRQGRGRPLRDRRPDRRPLLLRLRLVRASTACCSRAGRRARSTASSARCARPRS